MKEKNIVTCILLSILTCGIYGIIWFVEMTDDAVAASNGKEYSTSGISALLYTIITCGIYSFYWSYKMGKSLYAAKSSRGQNASDNSTLYVLLGIFQLNIVSYCLIQSDLNDLSK